MQDLKDLGTVDIFESLEDVADPGIKRALGSLGQRMKERNGQEAGKTEKRPAPPKSAEVVQLPFWPEPARGVPNSALRGALFAAIQGKDRRYMKRELLAVQQGVEIRFTGMQLDQSDLDVWEQALHLARLHPLGNVCDFTANAFLKAMGKTTGKANHEILKDTFSRLTACEVEMKHGLHVYAGSLVEAHYRNEDVGRYIVKLNRDLINLYAAGWTACDWQQRQQLRGKPLALWLHGFYSTHAKPHPMKVETLMKLSGSRTKEVFHYKANLKKNLALLQTVGVIQDFDIDGDLVSIDKTPSDSQRKNLTRARPRRK